MTNLKSSSFEEQVVVVAKVTSLIPVFSNWSAQFPLVSRPSFLDILHKNFQSVILL